MEPADIIGWGASAVLLATLTRQVWVQWRERSTEGVSSWLFVGQLVASAGFLVYSWMLGNWVFVFTNSALLVTAVIGQFVYRRNVRLERPASRNRTSALSSNHANPPATSPTSASGRSGGSRSGG